MGDDGDDDGEKAKTSHKQMKLESAIMFNILSHWTEQPETVVIIIV